MAFNYSQRARKWDGGGGVHLVVVSCAQIYHDVLQGTQSNVKSAKVQFSTVSSPRETRKHNFIKMNQHRQSRIQEALAH